MKFLVIFSAIIAFVSSVALEEKSFRAARIYNGVASKANDNLDYCSLTINYVNKCQTCGGALVDKNWILTSCRCANDYQDKEPTSIIARCGKSSVARGIDLIVLPDGKNGATLNMQETIEDYERDSDNEFNVLKPSCFAMLKVNDSFANDIQKKSVVESKITTAATLENLKTQYQGDYFRLCGKGVINDAGKAPSGLMCADTTLYDKTSCKAFYKDRNVIVPDDFIPDSDAAVCALKIGKNGNACGKGDFGGPCNAVKLNSRKEIQSQELFGIMAGAYNYQTCQGEHSIYCTTLFGKAKDWVLGVIAERFVP